MLNGGEPVGNHQGGAPLHQALQGLLHQAFRFGVQGGGGLVQNQNRRIFVQRTGNGQALALAAGQLAGVVPQRGVNALGQGTHMLGQIGRLQALPHALFVDGRTAQSDVGGHAVVEHHHVLADHGKLLAQIGQIPLRQRHAVDQNLPAIGLQKAR